jgi:hypothetical protein
VKRAADLALALQLSYVAHVDELNVFPAKQAARFLCRYRFDLSQSLVEQRLVSAPHRRTITFVPIPTLSYRYFTSLFDMRMQPEDMARPSVQGWLVPWMR